MRILALILLYPIVVSPQTIMINGTGKSITINEQGSSSVTINRPIDIINGIQLVGRTSHFYGNSITFGQNASSGSLDWTTLFCSGKGALESNSGIGGSVMQSTGTCPGAAVFNKTTIATYSASKGALFLSFGTNDIKYNNGTFTPSGFKTTLLDAIEYAHTTKGWPYGNIVIMSPFYNNATGLASQVGICSTTAPADWQVRVNDYITAASEAASETGAIYININGAMAAYSNPNDLLDDNTHPNDLGHAFIADYLIARPEFNPAVGDLYATGATALTFPTNTNLTNTGGVIAPTTPTGSYGNTGLSSAVLTGDFRIAFKVTGVDGLGGILGINTVNAQTGFGGMEAGAYLGTRNTLYRINNGSSQQVTPAVTVDIGSWVSIKRTASVLTIETSSNAVDWAVCSTFSLSTSAQVYGVCDVYGVYGILYYPQVF